MRTFELLVKERAVKPNSPNMRLVRTSVGVDQIHVLFDNEEWLGFPITATFAQGSDLVTVPLTVSEVDGSEWVAQATVAIPAEVIDMTGSIRVTLQGTDSEGRHIITARGAPLTVVESGDVASGDIPSDAPSVSQWQQAYADAQALINQVQGLADNLQSRLDEMVAQAQEAAATDPYVLPTASEDTLGGIRVGSGLSMEDGVLSANVQSSDASDARTSAIVDAAIESTFSSGTLASATVKPEALPIATMESLGAIYPDGTSIVVDDDGMAHAEGAYVPTATTERLGAVKPDGTTITVDADGTIHGTEQTQIATTSQAGKVRPDGTTITVDSDGTMHAVSASTNETDPTVPAWAKQPTKPTYTAQEVGALPDNTVIPTKVSDLTNDSGYITSVPVATTSQAGKVKPDGTTITVDSDGTMHGADTVPIATASTAGKVKPDGTTITVDEDGTIHGSPADWRQDDPYGVGYIRNRPFHDQEAEVLYHGASEQMTLPYSNVYTYPYLVGGMNFSRDLVAGEDYVLSVGDDEFRFTYTFGGAQWSVDKGRVYGYSLYLSESHGSLRMNVAPGDGVWLPSMDVALVHVTSGPAKLPARYLPVPGDDVGAVRPDGATIAMDQDGTIRAVSLSGPHWEVRTDPQGNRRLAIVIPEDSDG